MSLKSKPAPTAKKRSTTTKSKATPEKVTRALTERVIEPPTLPENALILPAPALLEERHEADALMEKLTKTLPARLEDEMAMGQASEHLVIARKLRKAFEDKLTELKKPIKKVMDDLTNDYNPYIVRLKDTEGRINTLLNNYRAEATRKQQLEQQQRDEEHRKQMQDARAQGMNPLSIPAPLPAAAPPSGFQTAHGKTTTMRIAKWRVTDEAQIPYEYNGTRLWLLNDAGIGALRRGAGVEAVSPIPGIEFYYEETTVVK